MIISGSGAATVITLSTEIIILILLIITSAFMSGSEAAYFSLGPNDLEELRHRKGRRPAAALKLLGKPDRLLGTLLLANNIANIAIIILSAFISSRLFDLSSNPVLSFIIEVVVITFILLLFGEVTPKIYATRNQVRVALMGAPLLTVISRILGPAASVLARTPALARRNGRPGGVPIRISDLSTAIDLTSEDTRDDRELLRGVVRFGNTSVSAIMCPRIDVTALDISKGFHTILPDVIESGFSRIPVYSGSFDNVKGILFIKDLLPHLGKPDSFRWQSLIRPPYVVPETKMISGLLKEFQEKKIHMAIVVDEYGGTSGLVTLEDILEEIVGEITDETDDEEPLFRETGEGRWIFDGKILLNDFYRIMGIDDDPFSDLRGESETLAGLLLELLEEMPAPGRVISAEGFRFTIEKVEKRRIREISVERKGGEE